MFPGYAFTISLYTYSRKIHLHVHFLYFFKIIFTQRLLEEEAQQFLVVLIRCGGSEKKKKSLFSVVNGLEVLYTSCPAVFELCSLIKRRLVEAPSDVHPITYVFQFSI